MKIRYPLYYKHFKCIAEKCQNSCCSAGWEINIDAKSSELYKNVSGEFGDTLRKNINFNSSPSQFILKANGRCPFLNNQNLCDIYTILGKDNLCSICREHPRFYEYFDDVTECGIGLYCEEVTRIILSQTEKFSTYEINSNSENFSQYDEVLYKYLCVAREKIFNYLDNSNKSIDDKIQNILSYAYILQDNIEDGILIDEEIDTTENYCTLNIEKAIDFLSNLEPNDINWPQHLQKTYELYQKNSSKMQCFIEANPDVENYLKNIAIYFVYRYFLKGTFDEDVLSKILLMAISVETLKMLYFSRWFETNTISLNDCIFITRKYSEEVESNDDLLKSIKESLPLML